MFLRGSIAAMPRLVIILLAFALQISAFSTTVLFKQFREAIKHHREFLDKCPGTLIFVDDAFERHYQDIVNDFLQMYTFPIMIINIDTAANSSSLSESHYQQSELVCNHLIQFTTVLSNLKKVYYDMDLRKTLFVKYSCVIVINSSIENEDVDKVLDDIQSEEVVIVKLEIQLSKGYFDTFQWKIDGQVHHQRNNLQEPINYLANPKVNNLMGRKLSAATLHFPPAAIIEPSNNISATDYNISSVDGIETNLIRLLASTLNFTIEFRFNENPDDMWRGLRRMLKHREVDMAFGELYIITDPEWEDYISFTETFKTNHECFLVPTPIPYAKWMAVFFPLSISTWIATVLSVIFAVSTLRFVARWSINKIDLYFGDGLRCVLYVLGNLLTIQQPRGIHSMPNRVFMVAWLFAATITASAYRSGLISFLTQPFSPPPVETIEQLTKSAYNKIIFDSYYKYILMNSTDPYRRLLGEQLIATYNYSYMFSLLDTGTYAVDSTIDRLLYEAELRYPSNKQKNQPFYLMKECILPTRSSFGLQKNSPLKPYFDKLILRFVETGLVKYHRSRLVKEMREFQEPVTISKEMVPFTLNNLQGAFYLFACGVSISSLVFLLELVVALVQAILLMA